MPTLKQLLNSTLFELTPGKSDPATYERLFQRVEDPWNFRRSPYERGRLERLFAAARKAAPRSVLEVGCAEGAFTERLLEIADEVVGIDVSETALSRARARNPRGDFRRARFEDFETDRMFDLAVCAETLYLFEDVPAALSRLNRLARHVLVSYTRYKRDRVEPHLEGIEFLHDEVFTCWEIIMKRSARIVLWKSPDV
ncbi:MAG: class I SAM-dependent methyltransferase [Nitrospinota bacterium]